MSSPGMTGSVLADRGFGSRGRGEGASSWASTGGSNSSKQYPSKGSCRGGGLGISLGKGFKEVLNWIFPTGMDCGCIIDMLRGEDLCARKAGVCPPGQIGLYVFFRESQEHVLPNEEFFPI